MAEATKASGITAVAGAVGIQVIPVMKGFGKALASGTNTEATKAGAQMGKAYGAAAQKGAEPALRKLGSDLAKARSVDAEAASKVKQAEAQLADVRARAGASTDDAFMPASRAPPPRATPF